MFSVCLTVILHLVLVGESEGRLSVLQWPVPKDSCKDTHFSYLKQYSIS